MADTVITIKEVASYLKVNERTVYRLAIARRIPAFKVGNVWRFKQSDIDEWINAQANQGKGNINANN